MIERCPTESLYKVYLCISFCRKKLFIMQSPLVAQNYRKNRPFLLMSESPCLLVTPFHVLLSVPTCALKLPSRTIDSADVTFCKATSTSSNKSWYCVSSFGVYTCKMHSDSSCSLSLRTQNLPPSGIQ